MHENGLHVLNFMWWTIYKHDAHFMLCIAFKILFIVIVKKIEIAGFENGCHVFCAIQVYRLCTKVWYCVTIHQCWGYELIQCFFNGWFNMWELQSLVYAWKSGGFTPLFLVKILLQGYQVMYFFIGCKVDLRIYCHSKMFGLIAGNWGTPLCVVFDYILTC